LRSVSGGSPNSRSGREEKDLRDGDDGGDSSSLRSGKLSLDIDGELGGGKGTANDDGVGRKNVSSTSYGESKGNGGRFSWISSIE
jgi:hypothetical protein